MNRQLESSMTHKVEKATHLGWDLSFTTTTDQSNGSNVSNVAVHGSKEGSSLNVNISHPEQGASVNFHGCAYDSSVADAIIAEVAVIFGEGE